mgnify:FL=1
MCVFEGGLLDGLSGLVGQDSKLGTLLKAADALSKAKGVFDEVKQLAPAVHDHIKGGEISTFDDCCIRVVVHLDWKIAEPSNKQSSHGVRKMPDHTF